MVFGIFKLCFFKKIQYTLNYKFRSFKGTVSKWKRTEKTTTNCLSALANIGLECEKNWWILKEVFKPETIKMSRLKILKT